MGLEFFGFTASIAGCPKRSSLGTSTTTAVPEAQECIGGPLQRRKQNPAEKLGCDNGFTARRFYGT